ncbi:MAG: cytosine permease [Candidatus Methanomethylicia archaeon]|nr:cytosine permease [Candidatus Methanomethylicia archaeon]
MSNNEKPVESAPSTKPGEKRFEDFSVMPVPVEKRKSFISVALPWGGLTLSVTAFLVGTILGGGLALSDGILAVIVGNYVLGIYALGLAILGQRKGLTMALLARRTFGLYGQILPSAVFAFVNVGFPGTYLALFGLLLASIFPGFSPYIGGLIFIVLAFILAALGIKGLSWLGYVAIPAILLLAIYGVSIVVGNLGGWDKFLSARPAGTLALGLGISTVISTWITGATTSADLGRFAKSAKSAAGAALFAFSCTALLEGLAFMLALGAGTGDLVVLLSNLGLVAPAIIIYFLLMWSSADVLIYMFSLAFTNIENAIIKKVKVGRFWWTTIGSAYAYGVGVIILSMGLMAGFRAWLSMLAQLIPPIGGIVLVDYYLFKGLKEDPLNIVGTKRRVNISAIIAWIMGVVSGWYPVLPVPILQNLLVAAAAYIVLEGVSKGKLQL